MNTRTSARGRRRPSSRWTALLAGVVATFATGCGEPDPVVLGVSLRSSMVDAARLAVQDGLASGPIPGFDTVMTTEAASSATAAVHSASRFIRTGGAVAVVGHSNSAASLATSKLYNDAGIVQLAPTTTAVSYSLAGPFSFRMVAPDDEQGMFLARVIARRHAGGTSIALFYVNDEYGRSLRSAVLRHLDSDSYPVIVDIPHVAGDEVTDFSHAVTAAVESSPDLILWLGRGRVLERLVGELDGALDAVPILGGDAVSSFDASVSGVRRSGPIRYVEFVELDREGELGRIRRRYETRYGREARGPEVLTYDAVRLVISAIRAGARSGDDLRRYLDTLGSQRLPFEGVAGPTAFDEDGDAQRSYVVVEIDTGAEG